MEFESLFTGTQSQRRILMGLNPFDSTVGISRLKALTFIVQCAEPTTKVEDAEMRPNNRKRTRNVDRGSV
jgi:hypothetical protein